MATLMKPDGSIEQIVDVHLVPYAELRRLLDGPVEYVYFQDGRVLLVNEEFQFRDFPFNLQATALIDGHHAKIHGPAILISAAEFRKIKETASGGESDE